MKKIFCVTCKRITELKNGEELLRCRCGEYEKYLLIDIDKKKEEEER